MLRESDSSESSDCEVDSRSQPAHHVVQGRATGLFQARNGSRWKKVAMSSATERRLHTYNVLRFHPGRTGATRLDGAWGKKQVWCPNVRTWGLLGANVLYWRKYLWHCWDFSVPPAVIRRLHSDSAPGELYPLAPLLRSLPGGTSYATSRVVSDSQLTSFRILFDEPMLRIIRQCNVEDGRRQTGDQASDVALFELEKCICLVVARSVIGGRSFPLKSLW